MYLCENSLFTIVKLSRVPLLDYYFYLRYRYGRPKRDISTIIHILNDLLCAAPPIALAQVICFTYKVITLENNSSVIRTVANVDEQSISCCRYTFQKESSHSCVSSAGPEAACGCSSRGAAGSLTQCDGHAPTAPPGAKHCECTLTDCQCNRLEPKLCVLCVGKAAGEICKKCDTAKTVAMENSKTKCKLEQLRLVMQQKKQRREARKLKTLPYTNSPSKTISSPEQAPVIQEEIETVA